MTDPLSVPQDLLLALAAAELKKHDGESAALRAERDIAAALDAIATWRRKVSPPDPNPTRLYFGEEPLQ